jgi:RNA polymerase sigma-70 factor (ECF subfamily)
MDEIPDNSVEIQSLLEQVRAGKLGAIDQLFTCYRAYLHQVIQMRLDAQVRQRVDVSDVIQETQLEANRRLTDYLEREPVSFRVWLRQIAHDRILKARRGHAETARRAVTREVPLPERSSLQLAEQLLAGGSTPSQQIAKREQARGVRQALTQLPDTDREIVLMRTYEKLSYDEIGYVLGIEPAAANMRHVRALMRLGKILRESGLTESQV